MKLKKLNESFHALAENIINEAVDRSELEVALKAELDRLMSVGASIKEFEVAFQDVIERLHPDKAWWEVCDLNIFWDLMESRDPEETVQHILDSMKEETIEEDGYSYNGHVIVDDPTSGNWFIKGQEGTFSTDSDAEEFIDTQLNEEMDPFYGSLCKQMDADNEAMYKRYSEGDVSPADALVELGYHEEDDHYLVKSVEQDGIEYEMIFDFSEYDYGNSDSYEYYVLKDKRIPAGWTTTFSTVDESLLETLQKIDSVLNEAEISDEDKHDSDLIRSMIQKMQARSNAAFSPEEKEVMAKYGITRDNYNKQLTVADRTLNPDIDNDRREYSWSGHRYSNGTPSEINYADRARKLPLRKANQIAGDGSRVFYQNAQYNAHGHGRSLQDVERGVQGAEMQQPMHDMTMALRRRDSAQRSIDNADAERERRLSAAQAAYDKAKKDADWHYDYDTVTSKKYRDGAQAEIDTLLKRKTETLHEQDDYKLAKKKAFYRSLMK